MFNSFVTFNIDFGALEASVHGLRDGLLSTEDYGNLTQCETLEDMKLHLSGTDYGNFLQNEPSPLIPNVIVERCQENLVSQVNEMRFHAVDPLSKFIDFVTYKYMIENAMKLIMALRNGGGAFDVLYKCHPLGLFKSIGVMTAADTVRDMYEMVLMDSPIGQFFTKSDVDEKDFYEYEASQIQTILRKKYLESFYEFCLDLGGETAEVMCEILEFEADRDVLTITRQTARSAELRDERDRFFPSIGTLLPIQDDLAKATDDKAILHILEEHNYPVFADIFRKVGDPSEEDIFDRLMSEREIFLHKRSMMRQFHFGVFYSIVKLKEQEIQNIYWIAVCIHQNMKQRVMDFLPLFSKTGFN